MGVLNAGIYQPSVGETGWSDEVNLNFERLGGQITPMSSAAQETAAIEEALATYDTVQLSGGNFRLTHPLVLQTEQAIHGAGAGVTTLTYQGSTSELAVIVGGALDAGSTTIDDHQQITGIEVVGNGVTNGIALQPAFCNIQDVWCRSGIANSALLMDSQAVPGTGAVHNRVRDCRFKSDGIPFDNVGGMTDFIYDEIVFLLPNYVGGDQPDFHATNSGGGRISDFHTNGSAGHCIILDNAMATQITDCYLDGFGCNPDASGVYAAVWIGSLVAGDQGSGVTISGLRNRHRDKVNANPNPNYVDVHVGGGFADGIVNISDITTWARSGATDPNYILELNNDHVYTLSNINAVMSTMTAVYRGSAPTNRFTAASVAGI